MAESTKSVATQAVAGQGVFLTGEFFSLGEPKQPWTDKRGVEHHPVDLTLAVNGSPIRVELEAGTAAELVKTATRGDILTLAVFVDGPWDPDARRFGAVRFRGR